ncbi:sugar transferase [Trichothermofontia sp.]
MIASEAYFMSGLQGLNQPLQSKSTIDLSHPSTLSWAKRLVDLLGAVIGLLVTALLFIPIAIAIKLEDPGPIFYSQIRCGHRGRTFRMWKFRSMVTDADKLQHLVSNQAKGNIFKNRHDPRVTRVGRFLRRSSLDEFPQFWNVLKGDMSLVGTRPPTVSEVMNYQAHHWKRLEVKPGITGEWQVRGRSKIKDFEEVVQLDLQYQDRWSLLYDLSLVAQTLLVIFTKDGAY